MTITPSFQLRQSATHVFLEISVPHIRIAVEEIQLTLTDENRQLHWYAPPIYLLVLNFAPYQFRSIEDEVVGRDVATVTNNNACQAAYLPHIDNGIIRIELEKLIPQQHWENLDLLGQWKPPITAPKWLQGVVTVDAEGEELPRPIDNNPSEKDDVTEHCSRHDHSRGFGFDRMFRDNVFRDLTRDGLGKEMLECPWPLTWNDDKGDDEEETSSLQSRRRILRLEDYENRLFSAERYQQDLYVEDDFIYQTARAMQPHWTQPPVADAEAFFTPPERQLLATIPYPLLEPPAVTEPRNAPESSRHQRLCLGLLDILFAYVYDHVTTEGDPTVESAWTVFMLSTSFSWCDDWLDDDNGDASGDALHLVPAVLCASIRRALIYPYLRSWEFAVFVGQQVAAIVRRGVRTVLRCLLQVRGILDRSELYYFGNKLYVDPYLIWFQQYPSTEYLETNILVPMADRITDCLGSDQCSQMKGNIGLNLLEIEANLWAEESSGVADDNPGLDERRYASSSEGEGTSDEEDEDDDLESGSSGTEVEENGESTIHGAMSTIPEQEEIHEEHEGASGLTGDLQRLRIDEDYHHPLDIFHGSKSNIQIPHNEMKHSDAKRTPLIQEVD